MTNKLRHLRSSTPEKVPLANQMELGQFAINTADGKVFIKKDDLTVQDITDNIFRNDTSIVITDTPSSDVGEVSITVDNQEKARIVKAQIELKEKVLIENEKELRFYENSGSGVEYVSFKAPNDLGGTYNLTLPLTAATKPGQYLGVDAGQLGWYDSDTFGGNRIYVSAEKGNDSNDGVNAPVKTIKRALQIASSKVYDSFGVVNGARWNISVAAGEYYEDNPIIVPDNVSVIGDGLRACILRPKNANKDMLRVRNGCYFTEFTFRDALTGAPSSPSPTGAPIYTWNYAVAFDDPLDATTSRVGYTNLPSTKPLISTSPYIQNCSIISFLGGNGVLVDGSKVVSPNTPANQIEAENPVSGPAPEQGKSMVANAFTMLSFGGTGWRVINEAYVQLVSCFQIFMLNGTYTQSGGYCSITNSATNFGLYALRAAGFSPNAFAFDKGYIGTTGTVGSIQTITAFGWTRPDGPVEEFVVRLYDPSTNADLTSSYKSTLPAFLEVSFDAAADVDPTTNVFTIIGHGFNNGDSVTYDSNGGTDIGGIVNGDIFWIKYLTADTFSLCFDDSLTKDVDITADGAGTQKFRKQDFEMITGEIIETHNVFQTLTLALGSPSGYTFSPGDVLTGTTSGFPNNAYVYSYDAGTRELVVSINKVTIGLTETRNLFGIGSSISTRNGSPVTYSVTAVVSRNDLYGATFQVIPTLTGGTFTNTATMPGKKIWFHRPSITNSSSHTWEYAGSGTDYNALPQNGGKGIPAYEQVSQNGGKVYTSGTNELGDFKVGNFITAFNRTGNVTFTNKITVDTLDVLRLGVGGVTVETISTDVDLGENEPGGPKDTRISTQLAIYSYAQNRLGNVLDKNVSTNAVPGSLVQLNSNGQINSDLIPTSRSFTSFTSAGLDSRLRQIDNIPASDMLSGDIASENFEQQELTISSAITASIGTTVIQTTGNTATTAITSGTNSFTVTHSGAVTVTKDTYVLIEGVTPAAYNGVWLVNRSSAGSFEVFTNINPGTATVQGTIYYGGASGVLKSTYTGSTAIIVGSVFGTFNTAFTTGVNTLIIGTDRTPSDTNTTVTCSAVTSPVSTSANYFLRAATSGQYLILDPAMNPTYTNGSISAAFRYNNNAYVTTSAAHNFSSGNAVKINAATASFDDTEYVTVTSATEFYYSNIAADSATSASTTATATLAGATSATTMTGSVAAASLTGTISNGDFVFDTGNTIPKGSKITAVNMAVDPRTFTITFPSASTVSATSTATLNFFTPAVETGTIRSVLVAADSLSQGEFKEYRTGVITAVNNLTGLTGGSGYVNGTYTRVPLTNVSGTGVGALADITVAAGAVTDVDIVFGGAGYATGNNLSASNTYLGGTGSAFQIAVNAVEKRVYVDLTGGQTFVATSGAPDFVEHNSSGTASITATATVVATFDATSTGSGGGVDTLLNRITTLAAHGFTNGDPVQYNPGADPAVGGLITNNVYYVKVINSTTVEMYTNYNLSTIIALTTSTGAGHTLTRRAVDITNNTLTVVGHGFTTGDAFRVTGSDLFYVDSVQITNNSYWFVGSVTTNSFTIHTLRADALSSISGVVLGAADITATGSGSVTITKASIKVTGNVNTSSIVRDNWNNLVTTNIDAGNIITGIINTSRLATGTANSSTFLRGDSTWSTAVQSAQTAVGSVLSITGSGSSPYYGNLTFDVAKADKTGGSGGYSTTGVASFNTTQFSVGTGDSLSAGQVLIKAGVIDAGTLDTYDSSYFLDPSNLTSPVPVSRGGTAFSSYTAGDTLYASAPTTLQKLPIDVADTVMTSTGSAPQWSSALTLARSVNTSGGELGTASTASGLLFNTNAVDIKMGGAATTLTIGSTSASTSLTANVGTYTTGGASSVTVTANITSAVTIATSALANPGTTVLAFASTAGVKVGQILSGSASLAANTLVVGVNATRVYINNATIGTINAAVNITFTDTNTSLGISVGNQVTIAGESGGSANLNGTWPVTSAGATSSTFNFKISTAVTLTNAARAGTVVKLSSLLVRNRNITIGSSEASATPVEAVIKGENAVGTNLSGAAVTLRAGLSTGTGTGGVINFQTGTTGTTGDVQQTAVTRMSVAQSAAATTLDLTTAMTTANLFNANAATVSAFNAATTSTLGYTGTAASTTNLSTGAVAAATTKTVNIGTGGAASSTTNVNIGSSNGGTTTVNSGTIVGALTSQDVFNTVAATVNAFGAATTLTVGNTATAAQTVNMFTASTGASTYNFATGATAAATTKTLNIGTGGAASSTTNVNIGSSNGGTTTINSGTIVGALTTQSVFNATATTVNAFGAATTLNIGAGSGTMTIGNAVITGTNATTLNLNGADPSVVTTSTGTASVFNTNAATGNLFGAATTGNIGYAGAANSTTNLSTGAVGNGNTKTVNIGTGGAAGSTTNVNIGSSIGGTTTINSTTLTFPNPVTISTNGNTTFSNNVVVGGNLTVNGTLTTVNSSTITIDDKNIELASVAVKTGLQATLGAGTAIVTLTTGDTTGLLAGQTLTVTTGVGVFGAGAVIASVDSLTQFTMTANHQTPGAVTFDSSGATDATANGGGFTIKGTTDKILQWTSTGSNFNSNQNIDINTGLTYKINNISVLGAAAVLQNAATASIGSLAAATDVQIGANNQNNTLTVHGNSTGGTATITTNVTTGTVALMDAVTGTINFGNAATTWNVGNTATAAQIVSMFGGSTGASTYSLFHGATANATTKTINIGTAGVSGSTTNVNIGSAVSGAVGTTTVNGATVNLGTNQSTLATVNVGPQITGNIFKVASPADGTGAINFTTDITTGTVNMFSSLTTGSVNIAVGTGASSINLGGVGGLVNIGAATGNSTLTIRGNGTTGTAAVATNVTTGTVNMFTGVTTGTVNLATGGASTINLAGTAGNVNIGTITGNSTLTVRGNGTTGTAAITTNVTTGAVNLMTAVTTGTITIGSAAAGRLAIAFNQASTSTTTGAVTIAGGLGVAGAINATTKSFIIPHPTKTGKLLKHGSLEGPEFGVYFRGRCTGTYIELPDYWEGLVDMDTMTVDLTPIGKHQKLFVEKIEGLRVYIGNDAVFGKAVDCFYTIWGARKDVDKLDIEVDE